MTKQGVSYQEIILPFKRWISDFLEFDDSVQGFLSKF